MRCIKLGISIIAGIFITFGCVFFSSLGIIGIPSEYSTSVNVGIIFYIGVLCSASIGAYVTVRVYKQLTKPP